MDIKTAVFNASRDGKLKLLEKLMSGKTTEELQVLTQCRTEGATPLLMAARCGHLEVVDFLLDCCRADVELCGCVVFDGETVEEAPPLWAASAAGHVAVAHALLRHGAHVDSTTRTESTALRAACFDGHLDVVRLLVEAGADVEAANRHGHTCLMIACYKGHETVAQYLLERGANVHQRSLKGNTALHDAAESGNLAVVKLLLAHGACPVRDGYGLTPLLSGSVAGHANIVEYLVHQPATSRQDFVDALELLGATFVDKKRDLLGAARYWRRAGVLRTVPPTPIPRVPAYGDACEATTPEELESLATDPDGMRTQALLVRERILGPSHPDTSYYIRYRGAVYADAGDLARCVRLWKHALHLQQNHLEPLSPVTAGSFLSFAELFAYALLQDGVAKGGPAAGTAQVDVQDLVGVLGKGVREVERATAERRDGATLCFTGILAVILHLLSVLQRLQCTAEQERQKRRAVYRLLRLNPRAQNGLSPLHMAVDGGTTAAAGGPERHPVGRFPSVAVASLLLDCGADVDSRDCDNNTPLHVAAGSGAPDVMALLLSAGAHFDATNARRKTAYELLGDCDATARHALHPLAHVTLQCLAARAVEKHRLPYKGVIPGEMEAFMELH